MKELIIGLAIALVISLGGNAFLVKSLNGARAEATRADGEMKNAQNVAKTCSDSVDRLEQEASQAAADHAKEIEDARKAAQQHGGDGQKILTTAPSSADACKAMADLANGWHASRKLK